MLYFKSLGLVILYYWDFELFLPDSCILLCLVTTILSLCISFLKDCTYKRDHTVFFISVSGFCYLECYRTWHSFNETEGTDSGIKERRKHTQNEKKKQELTGKAIGKTVPSVETQISFRQKMLRIFNEERARHCVVQWT